METIKVNMTPCKDVQTIHASQNDGEARQWEFELHNNGDVIDSSEVTDQMVFKAYKGGTEQLLPENTSTPTTSPFLGDIRYPQGLLTDQEFTYRQSPTESDGLAKIQTIYGNTLKWNQLVQNGNFADLSSWLFTDYATSVSDNTLALTSSTTSQTANARQLGVNIPNGHKFIVLCDVKVSQPTFRIILRDSSSISNNFTDTLPLNTWKKYGKIEVTTLDVDRIYIYPNRDGVSGATCELKNVMVIDLTAMFGSTKAEEIYAMERAQSGSGIAYFHSLYSLPYYQYDSGSLLPFRGEGLKTVGKNLLEFDDNWESKTNNGVTVTNNHDGTITLNGTATSGTIAIANFADVSRWTSTQNDEKKHIPNGNIKALGFAYGIRYQLVMSNVSGNSELVTKQLSSTDNTFTITNEYQYNWVRLYISSGSSFNNTVISPMIIFEGEDETFEPYTSSTLSLPISTYFPNGMNGVNDVHDELRNDGTTLKMNMVDLGSLNWTYVSANGGWFRAPMPSDAIGKIEGGRANNICPRYTTFVGSFPVFVTMDKTILVSSSNISSSNLIALKDTSYTDATSLKNSLQNVPLCYELATPTETSFTTASLVTENAEIPLSNNDGILIGKCTEQLSENPGFIDAKIKLSDADGACYSNKLQLHIERSPQ